MSRERLIAYITSVDKHECVVFYGGFCVQLLWLHPLSLCFQANRNRYIIKAPPCLPTWRLEDHLSAFLHSYSLARPTWSCRQLKWIHRDSTEVQMAADAVEELRQQCLKRGAAGIKGLGRQEKYSNVLQTIYRSLWIYESIISKKDWAVVLIFCLKLMMKYHQCALEQGN